ncbi:MAG: amidohydrolase [Oscillospiraceae bacterium]|jgi:predicted TIM-barrel fold metal-dependent hydrolase|nr:amidohydrolase [Oscillospiraceae bacterium]
MSNTIIGRAMNRDSFTDLKIIDMHCHLGPTDNFYFPKAEIEEMLEDADLFGTYKLCVAPHVGISADHKLGNKLAHEAITKFPDRVYGMLCFNPNFPEEIDCEFDAYYHIPQFVGVKIHPSSHKCPLTASVYRSIFERLCEKGGFLLTHTWESDSNCDAAACENTVKDFPGVNFILAHSLGLQDGIYKAISLVNRYDNCYMDTSGFEFSNVSIEAIMAKVDNNKVFFGSDMPFHDMRCGISRILYADLSDAVKEMLLSSNYVNFLEKCRKTG